MRLVEVEHSGKNYNLCFGWYKDISDSEKLMNLILTRDPSISNLAFINGRMISDEFTLLIAAKRALINRNTGSLKTGNIYSELLYCLSPTTKIKSSFENFGLAKDFSTVIVAKFDTNIDKYLQEIEKLGLGMEWTPSHDEIQKSADLQALSEIYGFDSKKLPKDYNKIIWSSIATKGFL